MGSPYVFKPFLADVPILYPLKTPENQKVSNVFRGYKIGILSRNGLTHSVPTFSHIVKKY